MSRDGRCDSELCTSSKEANMTRAVRIRTLHRVGHEQHMEKGADGPDTSMCKNQGKKKSEKTKIKAGG